jgi:dTDP-4-amino-4,6-dideoxygalactose transaminase
VAAVLATGRLVQGPVVEAFEQKLAGALGARHAIAVSSGTAALHLALAALGVGPGDEVIVPAFTFPATANVVEWLGARPVFCDAAPGDFVSGPAEFARAASRRTRALMPVHLFGRMTDVPAIARAAGARSGRRLAIVEDAACALGSSLRGARAGTLGDAGCFSFHPRKIITTGEGGLIVTARAPVASRLRALRSHGLTRGPRGFRLEAPGLNARMTDFQAALGLSQLGRLDAILSARAAQDALYREALAGHPDVAIPGPTPGAAEAVQAFVLMLRTRALRDRVAARLSRAGIETTFGTHCVPALGYYRRRYGLTRRMFPNAWAARERSLALPLHPALPREDQAAVVAALEEALR